MKSQPSSKPGKTKKRRRVRTSGSRLAPQAEYVLTNVPSNHNTKKCASVSRASSCGPKYAAFHASAMSKYPQHLNALNSSSKRVRIPARVSNHPVSDLTIDTAADVPCISASFIKSHPILQHLPLKPVPAGAIQLNSADGSALEILGYIRFNLTLGEITLPVEALVLPNLGPDKMLLDNSIMNAFGAVLDWCGEQLSFKNSTRKIPAKHKRTNSQVDTDGSAPAQISIVALDPSVGAVPVYLRRKCCIPPEHEMTVDVVTENAPSETTPALIEPRIVIAHDFESSDNVPQAFRRVVVARTVCNWSAVDKSAAVQIGNPSKRHVHLERDTILGYISPVKSVAEKTVSAVNSDQTTFRHKRDELKGAMKKRLRTLHLLLNIARKCWTYVRNIVMCFPCLRKSLESAR